MSSSSSSSSFHKVTVAVGTYDGVLAGWEITASSSSSFERNSNNSNFGHNKTQKQQQKLPTNKFHIAFASPVHGGSVRSLAVAGKIEPSHNKNHNILPGTLISCGYDEVVKTHDMAKRLTQSGEIRTPPDFGTPVCSSFAPPYLSNSSSSSGCCCSSSTHCLIGFSTGKLVVYKKRDWSVQHVLAGHQGGISAMGVHPTGKLALTGGSSDGKLKLWDLTKGRLAYVTKLPPAASSVQGRTHYDSVVSIEWSIDGTMYAVAHGSHITVREVATGAELLDADLPARINQICLLEGRDGIFCAAACNDGSLPVLAVNKLLSTHDGTTDKQQVVQAIMAIEPVDGPVAGEERFKCIQTASSNYHVVTANSAGVVSLMSLQGAVRMILEDEEKQQRSSHDDKKDSHDEDKEEPVHPESDDEDDTDDADSENDQDKELAVDIIDNVCLGSGARITCLVCWRTLIDDEVPKENEEEQEVEQARQSLAEAVAARDAKKRKAGSSQEGATKRKREGSFHNQQQQQQVTMDDEAIDKARKLVSKAKKIQKRKQKKKKQKSATR